MKRLCSLMYRFCAEMDDIDDDFYGWLRQAVLHPAVIDYNYFDLGSCNVPALARAERISQEIVAIIGRR